MTSQQAMGSLLCGPGIFLLFLALGCLATPGTHLCTTGPIDEAAICASVKSISEDEVRAASSRDHPTCHVQLAQYACIPRPWLQVWKEDFLTSLYHCLVASGPPSALAPTYSTLLFSKIDLPILETSLERFSQQFSQALLSDQWAGVLFNGLWGRLGPIFQAREAQVTWAQWLSGIQPFLLHPEAFYCLAAQNTSCETFHNLISVLNDVYSSLEAEKQRKIFEGIEAFLLQEGSGSHCQEETVPGLNSSSWLANYLGFFLERATEEELKKLVDEPKFQMLARDPATLHLVSQLHLTPDLASFYAALLTSPPRLNFSSIPDTLICHLRPEALGKIEFEESLALVQRLNKACFDPPPQLDGNKSVSEPPSWEALQVASRLLSGFGDLSEAVLRSLGPAAVGLPVSQIEEHLGGRDLVAALPALAQVRGWSPRQARALLGKLLESGYEVSDAQSLAALGSLVSGLSSAGLQSLAPRVVLEAMGEPGFAQHLAHIPALLKTAFVEQLALAVPNPITLVQAVPDTLTEAIPSAILAFSLDDQPRFDDLNSRRWTAVQAAMFFNEVVKNVSDFDSISPYILHGFTCASASSLDLEQVHRLAKVMERKNVTLGAEQLSCLAKRVSEDGIPEAALDEYPKDMLLFLSPSAYTRTGGCKHFFTRVGQSNVDILQKDSLLRSRLLSEALTCLGISDTRVTKEDICILGQLACDLDGRYINDSAEVLLPQLEQCGGPFSPDQKEATNMALRSGDSPYGPPSRWSVSTLNALQGLLPVLDRHIIQNIPQSIVTSWLKRALLDPSWPRENLRAFIQNLQSSRHRRDANQCPEGEITEISEELVIYTEKELWECLNTSLLAANLDKLKTIPFTYQQEEVFKAKLDKLYPDGYPEVVINNLGSLFKLVTPEDIQKWNVTSVETLTTLLQATDKNDMAMAVINRYIQGGGPLNAMALNVIGSKYFCSLTEEQLNSIEPSEFRMVNSLNPSACSQAQKKILYPKARTAFQGILFPQYYRLIQPYLDGAPPQDIKDLSQKNVNMDIGTFKKLQKEAILPLTPEEVRGLLGQNLPGLKAEEKTSPVREWILKQRQDSLDALGIGLTGGIPNGYIIISRRNRHR
ncbi:mesothelin [Monodelphis domestica]|nr:mesothelin [Monodelphis domestica]